MEIKSIPQTELRGAALRHEILRRIEADPSAWNQAVWIGQSVDYDINESGIILPLAATVAVFIQEHQAPPWDCGTAYCFAGHTVLACGAKLTDETVWRAEHTGGRLSTDEVVDPQGENRFIEQYARELLDLTYGQAEAMFSSGNSLEDLRVLVEALDADPEDDLSGW